MENLCVLRDLLRRGTHDEQQVEVICKLLAAVDLAQIDEKKYGLALIVIYLKDNTHPNRDVLNQFAASGFFNIKNKESHTALHWIIATPQIRLAVNNDGIRSIINHGGNPALTDFNGNNALHMALFKKLSYLVVSAVLEGQPKPSPQGRMDAYEDSCVA